MSHAIDLDNIVTLARVYFLADITEEQKAQIQTRIIEHLHRYDQEYGINFDLKACTFEVLNQLAIRNEKLMENGPCPELNEKEIHLIKDGLKFSAIEQYRNRTCMSLQIAKTVVDNKWDELINQFYQKNNPT